MNFIFLKNSKYFYKNKKNDFLLDKLLISKVNYENLFRLNGDEDTLHFLIEVLRKIIRLLNNNNDKKIYLTQIINLYSSTYEDFIELGNIYYDEFNNSKFKRKFFLRNAFENYKSAYLINSKSQLLNIKLSSINQRLNKNTQIKRKIHHIFFISSKKAYFYLKNFKTKREILKSLDINSNVSDEKKYLFFLKKILFFETNIKKSVSYLSNLNNFTNKNIDDYIFIGDCFSSLKNRTNNTNKKEEFIFSAIKNYNFALDINPNNKFLEIKKNNILKDISEQKKINENFIKMIANSKQVNQNIFFKLANLYKKKANKINITTPEVTKNQILLKKNALEKASINYENSINFNVVKTYIFTTQTNSIQTNLIKGYLSVTKIMFLNMFREVYKSFLFWSVCFFLPFLTLLLQFSLGLSIEIMSTFITKFIMIYPLIIIGIIILPRNIVKSRESNLFKRMITTGITKIQIYSNYIMIGMILLSTWSLFMFGPFLYILQLSVGEIIGSHSIEYYNIFFKGNFILIPLALMGYFSVLTMGYKKGMKSKSSSNLITKGFGIWIFIIITSGAIPSFFLNFSNIVNSSNEWGFEENNVARITILILVLIFKYGYLLNPLTLLNVAFAITFNNGGYLNPYISNEFLYYFTISFSIILSFVSIFWVSWNYKKITNFEVSR